jgi:hypothetical protein
MLYDRGRHAWTDAQTTGPTRTLPVRLLCNTYTGKWDLTDFVEPNEDDG